MRDADDHEKMCRCFIVWLVGACKRCLYPDGTCGVCLLATLPLVQQEDIHTLYKLIMSPRQFGAVKQNKKRPWGHDISGLLKQQQKHPPT